MAWHSTAMRTPLQRWTGLGLWVLLMVGCASQAPAPIEQKSATISAPRPRGGITKLAAPKAPIKGDIYRVQAGDTLYSIAWRLGVDFRQLAQWNGLQDPSRIEVGQRLRVHAANGDTRAAARTSVVAQTPVRVGRAPISPKTTPALSQGTLAKTPAGSPASNPKWAWPADGKVVRSVSATGSSGLEIRGTRGQTIRAAGSGQVVYGGSGLRGYGQLLIIKHDESFLSAYAHNDKLLVAEGQRIERSQPIALMGDSGASEVMLHFEIRKGGKAVEPLQYLPKR